VIKERNIVIYDDVFTMNRKRIMELCNEIIKEGMDLNWVCSTRVDRIDRELLKRMKRAGCSLIAYGVESGDQQVLDRIQKGISVEETENALNMTRSVGIKSVAYMLLGSPGETAESVERSFALIERAKPDYVQFNPIEIYPGSELYESRHESVFSEGYLDRIQKKLYRRYYLRPGYMSRQARNIRSFHDLKAAISGFRFVASL
jgi:anaerobic magnesium-protoporphyrin IX monomethyl ester cyclase